MRKSQIWGGVLFLSPNKAKATGQIRNAFNGSQMATGGGGVLASWTQLSQTQQKAAAGGRWRLPRSRLGTGGRMPQKNHLPASPQLPSPPEKSLQERSFHRMRGAKLVINKLTTRKRKGSHFQLRLDLARPRAMSCDNCESGQESQDLRPCTG